MSEPVERVFVAPLETEASARSLIASLSAGEAIDLAALVRLVARDVRHDLAEHIRVACDDSRGGEQRCCVEFRARGRRVHGAFMSLPKRSGR